MRIISQKIVNYQLPHSILSLELSYGAEIIFSEGA